MRFCKQLSVVLSIVTTCFASVSSAQEDEKALFQECLQAQAQVFLPLTQEQDAVYQKFIDRATSIRSIMGWLKDDYKTANAKRILEIATLENRLKALKNNANLTSAEATRNVAATVKTAKLLLDENDDERVSAIKPFSRKRAVLQREYKAKELTLSPAVLGLFREKGDLDSTASLIKSHGSFSYSSGTSSATYKRKGDDKSAAICYIYFFNDKVGKKEFGRFLDKYPISYRSSNQLEILVGRARVSISSADRNLGRKQLDATLASLVDIAKLESMLAP